MKERLVINHPLLGKYEQVVYDTAEEAGHRSLASEGKYGWEMPLDPVTEKLVIRISAGKVVVDLGCGLGNTVTIPCLAEGACRVYAWDVSEEHVSESSELVRLARERGFSSRLSTAVLSNRWWHQPLCQVPELDHVLGLPNHLLPQPNSVDVLVCRHNMQFGTPDTTMNVFDLASMFLKEGGQLVAINFTPYTGYMYRRDGGVTMGRIEECNWRFARGEERVPGGFLQPREGLLQMSLAQLLGKPEMDRGEENTFLYFDEPTLIGLMQKWEQSRLARGLHIDLEVCSSFYFTPPKIAAFNKLTEEPGYRNKENYIFVLTKRE